MNATVQHIIRYQKKKEEKGKSSSLQCINNIYYILANIFRQTGLFGAIIVFKFSKVFEQVFKIRGTVI